MIVYGNVKTGLVFVFSEFIFFILWILEFQDRAFKMTNVKDQTENEDGRALAWNIRENGLSGIQSLFHVGKCPFLSRPVLCIMLSGVMTDC